MSQIFFMNLVRVGIDEYCGQMEVGEYIVTIRLVNETRRVFKVELTGKTRDGFCGAEIEHHMVFGQHHRSLLECAFQLTSYMRQNADELIDVVEKFVQQNYFKDGPTRSSN